MALAQGLGATNAADIDGVQQALVRKLAREYLKGRFSDGFDPAEALPVAPLAAPPSPGGGAISAGDGVSVGLFTGSAMLAGDGVSVGLFTGSD